VRRRALAVLASLLLTTSNAHAQDDEAARAQKLYEEALALGAKGEWSAACPKLEESQALDPGLGTQFNLADCWEHIGRIGSAYKTFAAVERSAKAAGKPKLEARAGERRQALETRVARVRVVLAKPEPRAMVRIDGGAVPETEWARGAIVDAGEHAIEVIAPDKDAFSRRVAANDGAIVDVRVQLASTKRVIISAEPEPVPEKQHDPLYRTAGAIVAGAGVVGIGVGAVFGFVALSNRSDARSTCGDPDPAHCHDQSGLASWHDAKTAGTISTIAFVAGGALLATGGALWFLAPMRENDRTVGAVGGTTVIW
jgi:hypothetical protein